MLTLNELKWTARELRKAFVGRWEAIASAAVVNVAVAITYIAHTERLTVAADTAIMDSCLRE